MVGSESQQPPDNTADSGENVSLEIVRFCAIECALQQSGEESVSWMVDAWEMARRIPTPITDESVRMLGHFVEPIKNAKGYRNVGVRVGSSIKPPWEKVPRLMAEFLADPPADPAEWFRQYEEIHPFRDGNGRTGVILYNVLRGTLEEPEWAPDFWDDWRRTPGFGAPATGKGAE